MSRIARAAKSLLSAGRKLMSHTAGAAKSLLSKKGAGFIIGAVAVLFLLVLGIILLARDGDDHTTPQGQQPITTRGAWGPPEHVKTLLVGRDWVKVSVKELRPFLMRPLEDEEVVLLHEGKEYRKRGKDGIWTPALPEPLYPVQAQVKSGTKKMVRFEVATW